MPGLSLTIEQACRLSGCDIVSCQRAVEVLVAQGVLRWTRTDHLVLAKMIGV